MYLPYGIEEDVEDREVKQCHLKWALKMVSEGMDTRLSAPTIFQ